MSDAALLERRLAAFRGRRDTTAAEAGTGLVERRWTVGRTSPSGSRSPSTARSSRPTAAGSSGATWPRCPLPIDRERLAACRAGRPPAFPSSASTRRRPASRPRPARSRSSSASGAGGTMRSSRSSCSCPTTPTSRPCSPPWRRPAARRLARHVQRARLRLAAARGSLPDGSTGGAQARRPPRPAPVRPPRLPAPARGRPAALGRTRPARRPARRRRRRLGDPGPLPRLPARRSGGRARRRRPPQRARHRVARRAPRPRRDDARRSGGPGRDARAATSSGSPGSTGTRGGTATPSPASTSALDRPAPRRRRRSGRRDAPETAVAIERARTLRRLGRSSEALVAWRALAAAGGPVCRHRPRRGRQGARAPLGRSGRRARGGRAGRALAERARQLGRPMPNLEADLAHRRRAAGRADRPTPPAPAARRSRLIGSAGGHRSQR